MKEWKDGIWTYYDEDGNVLYRQRSDGSVVEEARHNAGDVANAIVTTSVVIGSVCVAGPWGLIGVALALCLPKGGADES